MGLPGRLYCSIWQLVLDVLVGLDKPPASATRAATIIISPFLRIATCKLIEDGGGHRMILGKVPSEAL